MQAAVCVEGFVGLCVCSYSQQITLQGFESKPMSPMLLLVYTHPAAVMPSSPLPAAAVLSVRLLQLFILRKFIEYELSEIGLGSDEVYFCSLSSATVVYKGQLTPEQVRGLGFRGLNHLIASQICCGGVGGFGGARV